MNGSTKLKHCLALIKKKNQRQFHCGWWLLQGYNTPSLKVHILGGQYYSSLDQTPMALWLKLKGSYSVNFS